jgi:acyl carrier protein
MAAWMFGRTTRADAPALVERWIARAEVLEPPPVIRTARAALDRPDATALLAQVRVPTLVVVGGEDDVLGRDEARRTAAGIARATLCEIPDAGHLVPVERGAQLAAAIQTWMQREVTSMADRDEVFMQVREILAQTLRVDPARIRPEAHLEDDLGMDSLRTIETNVALEARFGFVSPEVVRPAEIGIHTVDDLVAHVCSSIGATP